jgi:ZIP family zinc transporter
LLSVAGFASDLWKLLGIAWIAFGAMMGGALLAAGTDRTARPIKLVWGYGTASGAMLTSACLFLIPPAIGYHQTLGALGVAIGLIAGFALHTIGHGFTHRPHPTISSAVTELTVHALAAGTIIGALYATMPTLGPLLGFAIVSHKGPAGFATARRLTAQQHAVTPVLLPAASVGITALSVGWLGLSVSDVTSGLIFGFASGVFLHVAIDFFPRCDVGGEVYQLTSLDDDKHELLDRLRIHAILSTTIGCACVLAIWAML